MKSRTAADGAPHPGAVRQPEGMKIGFLPFYVDYYEGLCPDFPREKQANAEGCASKLAEFGEVLWNGRLICDAASAASAGKALARRKPDCVVVFTSIAVFGAIPWAALEGLTCPILIWNAQQIRTVGKGYSMVEIVRNTGQIGAQALANTLMREGRWFRIVTGYQKSRRTSKALSAFFRIVGAAAAVKRARLLALGEIFPMMTDILLDEDLLARHLGATVRRVGPQELTRRYLSIPAAKIRAAMAEMKRDNRMMGLTDDEARRSARLAITLESLVREHRADGGTFNCHGGTCLRNPEIGVTACYSLGVQNANGRPFTCTGDLPTAIAMLLLKKLAGVSMYTEVQVMDERRRAIVLANSGEGEDGLRRPRVKSLVRGNANFAGIHGRGASFSYPLKPGPATLASFTPSPKSVKPFRLIAAEGEIMKDTLPDAGGLAGFFRFKNADLHEGYAHWLEAGSVHHAATACGHRSRELADVAELLNIEFVGI